MSGIPVFSAGTSLQSSGAAVSAQIPADSAGMLPLFVRVTATAAGYFRLSQDGASAAVGDLLVQPSDGLILKTCGLSQFSFVSQSGASVVTVTPIDVGGTKYPTNIFTPAALFTTGVNGAWYDPSDVSTLFQNAAGAIPVTAVGQPVGLMLDKSKGLVLGPELVTNGDFTSSANWTTGSGWMISGGKLTATSVAFGVETKQTIASLVSGSRYVVTFDVVVTSGSLKVNLGDLGVSSTELLITASGTYTYRPTQSGTAQIAFWAASTFTGTIDNVSVKLVPGNHAYNPSGNSANFPVLQQDGTGRYYLAFNGVNQWLQTNSIDFTYGDKLFVSAGVRKLSDALDGFVAELSSDANTNGRAFWLTAPAFAGANFGFFSKGVLGSYSGQAVGSGYTAPTTRVLGGIGDISGDQAILRVNGSQVASSTADQGTGNFGNYPLYIGARAGTSLWFNGRLYGLVVAGKQASASEIASTESWLNQKTGAY